MIFTYTYPKEYHQKMVRLYEIEEAVKELRENIKQYKNKEAVPTSFYTSVGILKVEEADLKGDIMAIVNEVAQYNSYVSYDEGSINIWANQAKAHPRICDCQQTARAVENQAAKRNEQVERT